MELNSEALAFGKAQIAAAALIFLSTLLWACSFGLTGIASNDFFTFKFHIILGKVLSANMVLFLLTFPLPIAFMATFAKRMGKANLILVSMVSSLFALIAAMALFPALQQLWILASFYIISVPFVIETAFVKYAELKSRVTMRAMLSACGKATVLVSIGLFVLSLATIAPEHEQHLERFEDFMMDFAYDMVSGNSQQTISAGAIDLFIEAQVATIDTVLQSPVYAKLREKTDPDVIVFVLLAETQRQALASPEYRQEVEKMLGGASGSVMEQIDIMEIMKQQFPFIKKLEEVMPLGMWIGLMHALVLASVFSFLGLIIFKPLAAVYGLAAENAISLGKKAKPQKEKAGKEQAGKKPQILPKKG